MWPIRINFCYRSLLLFIPLMLFPFKKGNKLPTQTALYPSFPWEFVGPPVPFKHTKCVEIMYPNFRGETFWVLIIQTCVCSSRPGRDRMPTRLCYSVWAIISLKWVGASTSQTWMIRHDQLLMYHRLYVPTNSWWVWSILLASYETVYSHILAFRHSDDAQFVLQIYRWLKSWFTLTSSI